MTASPRTPINVPRARRLMDLHAVDGLLVSSPENVYYVSGLRSDNFAMLPRQTQLFALVTRDGLESPAIIANSVEASNVHVNAPHGRPYFYGGIVRTIGPSALSELEVYVRQAVIDVEPYPDVTSAAVAAIEDSGLIHSRIGYDERALFPENRDALAAHLPAAQLIRAWALLATIRAVKTADEISMLRQALDINESGIVGAMQVARPGVSQEEMVLAYERTVRAGGANPTFVQIFFGRDGAIGPIMGRRSFLTTSDVIRLDVGCSVNGYHSDIARNFVLREPDQRTRDLHQALLAGQDAAVEALEPGVTASGVFEAGLSAVRAAGIPTYDRHHIGHGIGLEVYDMPLLARRDHTTIEAGMVFEVETPYYELGSAGLQPEDTVIVTETGAELVGTLSRHLEIWPG